MFYNLGARIRRDEEHTMIKQNGIVSIMGVRTKSPVSIQRKSIAGRYRPVRLADGPITARCRFIKNTSWEDIMRQIACLVISPIL